MKQLGADVTNWKVKANILSIADLMNMLPWYQNLTDKSQFVEEYLTYTSLTYSNIETKIQESVDKYANTLEMYKAMTDYGEIDLPRYLLVGFYDNCDTHLICSSYGYWTLSSVNDTYAEAWIVDGGDYVRSSEVTISSLELCPVITLSKSFVQN